MVFSGAGTATSVSRAATLTKMPSRMGLVTSWRTEAGQLRRPPLGKNAPDRDHDRQMDGDQQEQGHGALVAIGLQDQRDADEDRVGLRGAEARDDAGDRVDPEEPPGEPRAQRPDDGHAT